jgi:integrase/recombinase XerC
MAKRLPSPTSGTTALGTVTVSRVTVSQLTNQFAAWLDKPGNYPRLARQFLLFCLDKRVPVDAISFNLYAAGKAGNQVSPIKKFLLFYQVQGNPTVVADPPKTRRVPPAANELILGYLAEATHLRGDKTKESYTQALNAFFTYLSDEFEAGRSGTFSAQTIGQYVNDLRVRGLSAFTINFYLSAIKQLTEWVIKHRARLNLTDEQADGLRDVQLIRSLTVERGFYKDSLDETERDDLLASIDDVTDRAIVSLLVHEGLRTVEVTRLTIADIEFERGLLQVRGKGKHTKKAIKLFTICADALRTYLQSGEGVPISAPKSAVLFPDLKTAQIRYRVDKYLRALELKRPRMSAHSLRHTAGQLLINKGVEATWVQRQLRHELFETTQFYIRKQTERDYFQKMPDTV